MFACCSTKKKKEIKSPPQQIKAQPKYQDRPCNDLEYHSTNLTNLTLDRVGQNKEVAKFIQDYKYKQRCQEKEFVLNLIKLPEQTHIIDYAWASSYTEYINGNGPHPGSIKNQVLAAKMHEKEELSPDKDYVKINEQVWFLLVQIYKGGPQILINDLVDTEDKRNQIDSSLKVFGIPSVNELDYKQFRNLKNMSSKEISIIGLENDIFFCYLNSVLQCLMGIGQLNQAIVTQNLSENTPFLYSYYCLLRKAMKCRNNSIVSPKELQKVLQKSFSIYEMHDSSELLLFLIDKFREESKSKSLPQKEHTFIDEFFFGQIQSQINCPLCQSKSKKLDTFYDLSLPLVEKGLLQKKLTIMECVSMYFKEDIIEGGWTCSDCNKKSDKVMRKLKIAQTPNILILQLKRFTIFPLQKKIREPVVIDMEIDLKNYCVEGQSSKYQLKSMIVHSGTIDQGHYVAIVKRNGQQFYLFNDEDIERIENNQIGKIMSAYLLIYQKL